MALLKVWAWLKKYWWVVAAGIGIIVCAMFNRQGVKFFTDLLKTKTESHEEQLAVIKESESERQRERQKIEGKYNEVIRRLEEGHAASSKQLSRRQKSLVKTIVKEYGDDQVGLSKRLAAEFGITFVQ